MTKIFIFFFILIFILLSIDGYSKEYEVIDLETGELKIVVFEFDEAKNNVLSIQLLSQSKMVISNVEYKHLLWREVVSIEDEKVIKINFYLKGGMGSIYRKEVLLSICSNKLIESLNLMVEEKHEIHNQEKSFENYSVETNYPTSSNALEIIEKYELNSIVESNIKWENSCILKYTEEYNVYYTDFITLNNVSLNGKVIKGVFPVILLYRYSYLFFEGYWYVLDDTNRLYRA